MRVELLGRLGEPVGHEDVPADAPEIIAVHSRYFVRDETRFYPGTKYVEANVMRIEKRAEGARGGPENRKAAGA